MEAISEKSKVKAFTKPQVPSWVAPSRHSRENLIERYEADVDVIIDGSENPRLNS